MNESNVMNADLRDAIESYVELLERLSRTKTLNTEEVVKELVEIGVMMSKERAFLYRDDKV